MARKSETKSKSKFPRAFRSVRVARGLAQDAFEPVFSRVYVSMLERDKNSPSLYKIDGVAEVLGLHPLTVLALSYAEEPTEAELVRLFEVVNREVLALKIRHFSSETLPPGTKPPPVQKNGSRGKT